MRSFYLSTPVRLDFCLDQTHNGKGISIAQHNAPHPAYITAVRAKLGESPNQLDSIFKQMTDEGASLDEISAKVKHFQDWLDNLIEANPNVPLDDLASQISAYN